jgi:hypothetical protein
MKKIALLTGALCAIGSGALAQSVVIIPAFENRFAGVHQPVVALNTINRSDSFQRQTFGGSTFTTDPAARGVVSSPTAAARTRFDPTVMNVPVFPGNTAILMQQQAAFGFSPFGIGAFPNAGVGGSGSFVQQGGGSSLVEVDPFRTTATPGPAVNAVPNPAVNAVPNPAAPVPTIPQLQPTITPPTPQSPTILVPGQVAPGTTQPQVPQQSTPVVPNR